MDISDLRQSISKLPREKQERALSLARELEARQKYRVDNILWLTERLGIKREMIDWTLIPEYQNCHCIHCGENHTGAHEWDGTPNPLMRLCKNIVEGTWTAVEGGTGTSKTFTMAGIALWFLENFEDSMVAVIGPKERQLELGMWQEVQRNYTRFNRGLLQQLQLKMNPPDDRWIMTGFVAGVKASEAEGAATKAAGLHREHMLLILEETPGIHPAVIKALMNTCTSPHNIIVALGNPDHQLDALHTFSKLPNVDAITISGFDHPNVVMKKPDYMPGAQTEAGLARLKAIYRSPENPLYLSRARGISPGQSTDALIRLEWIKAAQKRESKGIGERALGVDVANSVDGDFAAIVEGQGATCLIIEAFPCPNANKLGEQVKHRALAASISPECVGVDGVGVGAGTINELLRLDFRVTNIQSAAKPIDVMKNGISLTEQFDILRSQMWWQLRMDLEDEKSDLVIPDDDELVADLVTPKYKIDNGKIKIESKYELKKRLGRSPNKGDAFVYWNWVRARRGTVAAIKQEDAVPVRTTMNERRQTLETYNAPRRRAW